MQKGGWIIGENDEGIYKLTFFLSQPYIRIYLYFSSAACYIDIDRDEVDLKHEYSHWNYLPDIVLEQVFSYLNVKDRYYASLVSEDEN